MKLWDVLLRGAMQIVLAPIHQNFSAAQVFLHFGNDSFRKLALQTFSDGMGNRFCLVVDNVRVERDKNLESFGAESFREALQFQF